MIRNAHRSLTRSIQKVGPNSVGLLTAKVDCVIILGCRRRCVDNLLR